MKEKDFQRKFSKWWRYNAMVGNFELKITKTKSLSFSRLEDHQGETLRSKQLGYKPPDDSIGRKPVDFIGTVGSPGYVVIMFYVRGCKKFYSKMVK